jgi:two-component system OmpR family sensor kinase
MARAQLAEPQRVRQVSLEKIIKIVFEELIPFADVKKIQLSFHQSQIMATVITGGIEMDWVTLVRNLVDNAIRYSAPEGRVDVTVYSDESQIVIEVQDNGPGIALDERDRVFDSFYRVLGTEQLGSGLGLSIVKSIVATWQGSIAIDFADQGSQRGTIVSVNIPQKKLG